MSRNLSIISIVGVLVGIMLPKSALRKLGIAGIGTRITSLHSTGPCSCYSLYSLLDPKQRKEVEERLREVNAVNKNKK